MAFALPLRVEGHLLPVQGDRRLLSQVDLGHPGPHSDPEGLLAASEAADPGRGHAVWAAEPGAIG